MIPRPYIYIAALVALLAILGGAYIKGRTDGREAAESKHSASISKAREEAERKAEADRAERDRIEREHLGQLRDLQARIDSLMQSQPDRVVCVSKRAGGSVPANPNAAAIANPGTGGDGSPVRARADTDWRDITPSLLQFARRCEEDRLARIKGQEWAVSIAAMP